MKKYRLTYHLYEGTEEGARAYCEEVNKTATPYARRKYPAHFTPYEIKNNYADGRAWTGFIIWYHYTTG